MVKLVEAMRKKNIPFSFLVGDLPTYKTIVQLMAENSEMYKDLIPILGAFHQQMSYIYAIYKRFRGSGMADTLVTAGQRLTNILEHEELSENIKENLNTLRNALTDTREALQAAHSNLEDDDGMKDLITRVYEKPGTDMGDLDLIHGDV
ncbi:Tudor domain containing protein 7 [Dissostichus eleginoides]|uniref:Tudor domain containing protein 7 n=1 Tax=Dissostichus eleginoides TaxID=100907 RepID=A0AAD9BH87_DISEL|nr:Tudor domain containing protein 7 [Dissostichus eleginoides]